MRMAINKKIIITRGDEGRLEKLEHLCITNGNIKWCSCYGK